MDDIFASQFRLANGHTLILRADNEVDLIRASVLFLLGEDFREGGGSIEVTDAGDDWFRIQVTVPKSLGNDTGEAMIDLELTITMTGWYELGEHGRTEHVGAWTTFWIVRHKVGAPYM